MKDRRIGRFTLGRHIIDELPNEALVALKDVIVIRAEWMRYGDFIEYHGIHPSFETISPGVTPPTYVPQLFKRDDGSIEHRGWVKT